MIGTFDNSRIVNAMRKAGHVCACSGRTDIRCDEEACTIAGPGGPAGTPEAGQCRTCYLRLGGDPDVLPSGGNVEKRSRYSLVFRKSTPCVFLQGDTGERRDCEFCGGRKGVPVYGCAKHGRCSPTGRLAYNEDGHGTWVEVPNCALCKDYKPVSEVRRIVLVNKQSPGDCLVMGASLECLHAQHPGKFLTAVETPCNDLFEHNPHVVPAEGDGWERIVMEYPLIHESDQRPIHFLQGYVDFLSKRLGIPLELRTNRPHIYLSDEEKGWKGRVEEILGEKRPYFVVNSGVKSDYTAKGWGHANYQAVVDALKDKVLFVQIGAAEHNHQPLWGAIDQVGKTTIRELIRLVYHADGVLCGTTFLMHVAAALEKPAVVLAGAREPKSWNTYSRQTLLSTVGMLSCAASGGCWRSRTIRLNDGDEKDNSLCEKPVFTNDGAVPKCLHMIRPQQVVDAILGFYEGGVLA